MIGNYTKPNVGIAVPGILAKGTYNGAEVNLLPYFNGMLASSNRGGDSGVAVNSLDDGGAAPLLLNKPANGTTSNQYKLLTHLYQYFGFLLGCSEYGVGAFPAYSGFGSMAAVHRFMDLDQNEVGYFIEQVGLAAASFGVTTADIEPVGAALMSLFGYRCAPPTVVIPVQGALTQSVCLNETCPIAPNSTCSAYPTEFLPALANSTNMSNGSISANSTSGSSSNGSSKTSSTASITPAVATGAAGTFGAALGVVGAAALAFAL